MNRLIATFGLLTRLPIPRRSAPAMWSPTWFPVVGAVIGCLLATVVAVTGPGLLALPSGVAAWIVLATWVMLTGGLHLDGLMDTADGLMSGRPAPRALDIMRDSRVGGMGVLAGVLLLMGKWVLIGTLVSDSGAGAFLLLIPLWARWGGALAVDLFPYARREGMASDYVDGAKRRSRGAWGSTTTAVIGTAFLIIAGRIPLEAVALPIIVVGATFLLGHRWVARFGGLTGDLYGALIELNELLALLLIVIVFV